MDPTLDRWLDAIKVGAVALGVGASFGVSTGSAAVGGLVVVVGLVAAWVVSPVSRVGAHVPHERAMAAASPSDVVVHWRPGCSVCIALRSAMDRQVRDRVTWVNVVRDPVAAAFVRRHNDGDMVTPTTVTGDGRLVESTPAAIAAALAG